MKHVDVAAKYIGEKELPGNVFKDDPKIDGDLGQRLKEAGQLDGESWCALFAEVCFVEAYPEKADYYKGVFSKGAVSTFKNFIKAGITPHQTPKVGDLIVWQRYKNGIAGWQGHVGIVSKVESDTAWFSIEGNTNGTGSREGNAVAEKYRVNKVNPNGLNVLGFLTIA